MSGPVFWKDFVKGTGLARGRFTSDRFGERIDLVSCGADGTAAGNSAALRVAVNIAIARARPCVIDLPPGDFPVTAYDSVVGTNEGACIVLASGTPNLIIQGHGGGLAGTTIKPASNRVEIFTIAGGGDLTIQDVTFDNTANGILSNTASTNALSGAGQGVAQLGNGANCAVRQYYGGSLTVRRCTYKGFQGSNSYIGDFRNAAITSGTVIIEDCEFDTYCFGLTAQQPRVVRFERIRSRNRQSSINADASVDPGHDLYVTNRSGAHPSLVMVKSICAEGTYNSGTGDYTDVSRSSSIKVRKGKVVSISGVTCINTGKGVEVFNAQNVSLTDCSVKLLPDDQDTNQAAFELTDCGTLEFSNLIADVQGVSAWGIRMRQDLNDQPWQNRNVTGSHFKIITDHTSGGVGKAPMIISGQTDCEFINPLVEHHGTVANSNYPFDVRSSTHVSVVWPRHRTPDSPSDAYRLVSFDSNCINCTTLYRDQCIDTAVTTSTINDNGTGSSINTALLVDASKVIQTGLKLPALNLTVPRAIESWFGEDRLNVIALGMKGDGLTVDSNAMTNAISAMQSTGIPLQFPRRTYLVDQDFVISFPDFQAIFEGDGATFIQQTLGMGLIRGIANSDRMRLRGRFGVKYLGTRSNITGNFRGYTGFQRMNALWWEGSYCEADEVWQDNMYGTVCVRGPVLRIDGTTPTNSDSSSILTFTTNCVQNRIRKIVASNSDFALTGLPHTDLHIETLAAFTTTNVQGIDPHAIYMTSSGDPTYGGTSYGLRIDNAVSVGNNFAPAFKFRDCQQFSFGRMIGRSTPGVLLLASRNSIGTAHIEAYDQISRTYTDQSYGTAAIVDVVSSDYITVDCGNLQGRADQNLVAAKIRGTSKSGMIRGARHIQINTTTSDSSNSSFRTEDTAYGTFVDCEGVYANGMGNRMCVGTDSSTMNVVNPKMSGATALAVQGSTALLAIDLNSSAVDGFVSSYVSGSDTTKISVNDRRVAEGAFTPTLLNSGGSAATLSAAAGRYHREGNYVTVNVRIATTVATGFTGSSTLDLGGLPYTPRSGSTVPEPFARVLTDGVTVATGSGVFAFASTAGNKTCRLQSWADQTRSNLPASALGTAIKLEFQIIYETTDAF